jgi:hypothetical protein
MNSQKNKITILSKTTAPFVIIFLFMDTVCLNKIAYVVF